MSGGGLGLGIDRWRRSGLEFGRMCRMRLLSSCEIVGWVFRVIYHTGCLQVVLLMVVCSESSGMRRELCSRWFVYL